MFKNDMVALKEKNKDKVTLDNVFELASDQESESSDESEKEQDEEVVEENKMVTNDMLSSQPKSQHLFSDNS